MSRHVLCVVALAALLGGCSSGDKTPAGPPLPAVSSFTEGTCRTAAPDVLAIGRAIPKLAVGDNSTSGSVPREVKDSLRDAQDRLAMLAEAAEPTYKPALDALVVQVGLVRIRADGNTYAPELGTALGKDYTAVLSACGAND